MLTVQFNKIYPNGRKHANAVFGKELLISPKAGALFLVVAVLNKVDARSARGMLDRNLDDAGFLYASFHSELAKNFLTAGTVRNKSVFKKSTKLGLVLYAAHPRRQL